MAEEQKKFKRLSISTDGSTTSVSQDAKNLSEALEQELKYYNQRSRVPAQINLEEEK